ncbi:Hypothetical protein I595_2733 [Croceitalea dokdonensis DOKDO 023]|uniref:Secreted protein n=1 Tax=Croceitalea dokdonensis DOKDO 023 TaxID=1300341 RepID=A0A0P7AI80_9FLAO|nr:hypothetical protein [Croceitalea dokdonensis]KPM31466.1 Hypothetical protein I595_2733 [Croceitalea dokdonensis DOKDO 023]
MKIILLLITVAFSSLAVGSCTNDEGEQEVEFLDPTEEQNMANTP